MEFRRSLAKCKNGPVLLRAIGNTWPKGTLLALLAARLAPHSAAHADQVEPSIAEHFSIAQRQAAMDFGRASVALEGFKGSPEGEALQQEWVHGEITIEECIAA